MPILPFGLVCEEEYVSKNHMIFHFVTMHEKIKEFLCPCNTGLLLMNDKANTFAESGKGY